MAHNHNKCPHMDNVVQLSLPELCKSKQGHLCSECDTGGPNLWICLQKNCLHIGCSEQVNDHSTKHFKSNEQHCIHMNLSSQRIWCYLCETEVFMPQQQQHHHRRSSLISNCSSNTFNMIDTGSDPSRLFERMYDHSVRMGGGSMSSTGGGGGGESPESSYDEDEGDRRHMDGLVGLQNIANTCYMNAALQALSNSPPLLQYFLNCGDIIEANSELCVNNQRKPGLAKSYHRLIKTMWCRNKRSNGYVVPRDILTRIRHVHPMFRGFQQHDTQEFLRCFMDQLHEELKEVTPPPPEYMYKSSTAPAVASHSTEAMTIDNDDDQSPCSTPSPSQSEAEYETCDSGVSERSSLSDEIQRSEHLRSSPSPILQSTLQHSASPNLCQKTSIGSSSKSIPYTQSITSANSTSTSTGSIGSGSGQQNQQQREKSPPKRPHRSIISDVFDGKLLSSVQCLTCNRISTREETFQDLSLPIPGKDHLAVLHQSQGLVANMSQPQSGVTCTDVVYQAGQDGWFWWIWNWLRSWFWGPAVSLHDCMAAFFSADELKGDNMYSCEKCHKLRNGIKYSRVLELPEMLCVHLKRFRHDLSYSSKISSPVHFPLTGLDMRPYLHKDCKSEISTYDLTAVICHHGTVGGGHYTSFAKHELTGKWFEFDDQLVTEVTPEIVQNCQAYVLFYRKSNPKMLRIRQYAKELSDSNPMQSSDLKFYVSRQWINRFHTFAEPGPIDNYSILCPHGGLPPCKTALLDYLVVQIQQPLWDFLYKEFGGGPICNRLFECDTCRHAAELLSHRQENELEAFTRLKSEFENGNTPTTIYAISMAWFRQWQLFAEGKTNEEPGPIYNAPIAITTTTTTSSTSDLGNSSGTIISGGNGGGGDGRTIITVRPGSDYAQLNKKSWKFFHSIYGGGPEIILRLGPVDDDDEDIDDDMNFMNKDNKELEIMEIDQDQINQDHISSENQVMMDDYSKANDLIDTGVQHANNDLNNGGVVITSSNSNYNINGGSSGAGGQLKIHKNVSFEDEIEDSQNQEQQQQQQEEKQQQQQQLIHDTIMREYGKERDSKRKKRLTHYSSLRLSKEENDLLNKFCEKLELKESFGLDGKYQTKTYHHNNIPDSNTAITTAISSTTTTKTLQQSSPTQTTKLINHESNLHNNNNNNNNITTTAFITRNNSNTPPLIDPYSDSSNSNYYPKIQSPQTMTNSSIKLQQQIQQHQQQQQQHPTTISVPSPASSNISGDQRMTTSLSKRKIGEVAELINYQPFQASSTKVELKSYRKVDPVPTSTLSNQQQQQPTLTIHQAILQQQQQQQNSTELKVQQAEMNLNAESKHQKHHKTKNNSSMKMSARERRRNMTRKAKKYSSDPNNSDSG